MNDSSYGGIIVISLLLVGAIVVMMFLHDEKKKRKYYKSFDTKPKVGGTVNCSKCNQVIPLDHPNSWCIHCGERLSNEVIIQLRKVREAKQEMPKPQTEQTGKCPFCHGEIESGVLKCKHCGEWLDKSHRTKEQELQRAPVQTVKNSTTLNKTIRGVLLVFIILYQF